MSDLDIATLPEPLKSAFIEFEASIQGKLPADQVSSVPECPFYHYTDQTALYGILEKHQLWCFLHSDQSDPSEVSYSMEIARRVIREEAARGSPPVESLLTGLDDLLESNPLNKTFDFYFFSLSRHRDDPASGRNMVVRALASPSASPLLCSGRTEPNCCREQLRTCSSAA